MNENYTYPIWLRFNENEAIVSVPDLKNNLPDFVVEYDAQDFQKMLSDIQTEIGFVLLDYFEREIDPPIPKDICMDKKDDKKELIYINIWMPYFCATTKEIYVQKNVTIPKWMDILAKQRGINISNVLNQAIKEEIVEVKNNERKFIISSNS